MAKTLSLTWPKTSHRLCIWHLYQNLSVVFEEFQDFNENFSKCIYEYEEEDEFIKAWYDLLDNYGLRGNRWMNQTFALKEKWALVYDFFTTLRGWLMIHISADFKATQRSVSLSFNIEIVRHATPIYILALEVSLSYDCSVITSFEIENVSEYKVMPYKKHFQHIVKYDSNINVVTCSCKKFEFRGTKQAKIRSDRGTCLSPTHNDQKAGLRSRYKDLCGRYT
ncbi:hypothetical protein Lal_00021467 [Lupinus albus]|nr:hypothetical protein Lal_00021467 [Lupinus albus]